MKTNAIFSPFNQTTPPHWRKVGINVGLIGLFLVAIDILVGIYQNQIIAAHQAAQAEIERMAWFYVRADVDQITYTPDKKYQLTLWIENLLPERDAFVMLPSVQGAIQVGSQWQALETSEATRNSRLSEGSVINLTERITVGWIMDIPELNYFQAFPGYMHIQIHSQMLVSPVAEPKEHVAERHDLIYLHLKPIGADNEQLRRLNGFPKAAPIFVPTIPRW